MKSHRLWPVVALVFGVPTALFGLSLVLAYLWWAVIDRIGEADQSLLFWYGGLLMVGIMFAAAGIAAVVWATLRMKRGGSA